MRTLPVALIVSTLLVTAVAHASDDVAHGRYERGIQLYQQGRFAAAVDEFKGVYQLTGSPALLFNLGQCYRQLGDRTSAITSYRAYLHQLPDAPNRTDVEALLHELEVSSFARVPPPTSTPLVVRTDRGRRAVLIGSVIALGIVGTGCIAGAGALSLRAENAADALRDVPLGTSWSDTQASLYDEGRQATSAAIGLYAVGGVALAAGVVTALLTRHRLRHAPEVHATTARFATTGPTWAF